ncbi:hypothetical protein BC829DRAFT_434581 [Chytridium lagenaria]|nr:hypothetical protein BC829DRAFT_434581 [Chytridium lagenaria]
MAEELDEACCGPALEDGMRRSWATSSSLTDAERRDFADVGEIERRKMGCGWVALKRRCKKGLPALSRSIDAVGVEAREAAAAARADVRAEAGDGSERKEEVIAEADADDVDDAEDEEEDATRRGTEWDEQRRVELTVSRSLEAPSADGRQP